MKTVIVDYSVISPESLSSKVRKAFPNALCKWKNFDTSQYEFSVFGVSDLEMLEDILAEYM